MCGHLLAFFNKQISTLLIGTPIHFVSIFYSIGITLNQNTMKGLKRESNIHLRISEQEKVRYSKVADEIGLSLSAFARYSMVRTSRMLNQVKKEL